MSFFRKNLKQDILNGLVGWWKFDENSGLIAFDSSGNGNHGTLVGGPIRVVGKIGRGLRFDGAGDYVGANAAVTAYPFTISLWFRTSDVTGTYALVSINDSSKTGTQATLLVRGASAGDPVTAAVRTEGSFAESFSTQGYTANTWYHIVGVFTHQSSRIVYLNAVPGTENTDVRTVSGYDTTDIGRLGDSTPGNDFLGSIDDVRIYNRALSPQEVSIIYNSTKDGYQ